MNISRILGLIVVCCYGALILHAGNRAEEGTWKALLALLLPLALIWFPDGAFRNLRLLFAA